MSTTTIYGKLFEIVSEQLSVENHALSGHSEFVNDIGADSLDVIELIMEVEEEFQLSASVPDEIAEKLRSISDVATYLQKELPDMPIGDSRIAS